MQAASRAGRAQLVVACFVILQSRHVPSGLVWYVLQPILSILVVNQGLRLPAYLENTVLSQEPKFGQIQCII
jgi:hypothetical protein